MRRGIDIHDFHIRRAIRGAAALLLAALIVFLVADDIDNAKAARAEARKAREASALNAELLRQIQQAQRDSDAKTVASLVAILDLVTKGEERAQAQGTDPKITFDKAVEALKEAFPPALVEQAVQQQRGEQGPPGPQGPPGQTAAETSTTTTTTTTTRPSPTTTTRPSTTTTSRPCLIDLLGLAKVGCR
jgi:hypothetical protein